jgi:DNA-directed RNA polymerase specialized sigma24 family protein
MDRLPPARLTTLPKESGVAHDQQQEAFAARRATYDAQFAALPPPGTTAWRQTIERTDGPDALPYEVLARCYRARLAAGADDAERIFNVIMLRIGPSVRRWAAAITSKSPSSRGSDVARELEQESYIELWEELRNDGPTFLFENFAFAFGRIRQHVALDVMQRAGEWKRRGVLRPKRIPRGQMERLDAEPSGEHEVPLAETLADPEAQRAFDRAEWSDLFDEVRHLPHDEQIIVLDLICGDRTRAEVAARLGVTDRTVRNHVKAIVAKLRRLYLGPEEENHA